MDLTEQYHVALVLSGIGAGMALVLSAMLIAQHLATFTKPRQQTLIIIIIGMVPLFAVNSFVGLLPRFIDTSEWVDTIFDSIKECYEAVVIWSFLELLFEFVGIGADRKVPDEIKGREIHQPFPMGLFLPTVRVDPAGVRRVEGWARQFMLIRPALSVAAVLLEYYDLYDEHYVWVFFTVALNVSITLAVHAVMVFEHAFAKELAVHRPMAKFLCIKGVVFFAFWQGIVLEALARFNVVRGDHWYEGAVTNWLVCLEMGFLFSFAHRYAYPPEEFAKKKTE
eukprot:TRINITY_DN37645_c0_g1_i1.p2 TRINITY_DN37645_c0_g1~~TRINITY_DN37645_c0_g1_i1.p2  ORF type:complete len:300 (+),score=126.08 TRINITY_DN37645_c0_g1_i1:60-902(+)